MGILDALLPIVGSIFGPGGTALGTAAAGALGGAHAPPSPALGGAPGIGDGSVTNQLVQGGDRAAAGGSPLMTDLGGLLRNAVVGRINSSIAGMNQRVYNNKAYPGVPAWELTGTGSAGASAGDMASPELAQRERESKRSAEVSLQTSRMSAVSSLAGHAMDLGGQANGPFIASLLRSGGLIPPGVGFDPSIMAKGKPEAEIAKLNADTSMTGALLPGAAAEQFARTNQASAGAREANVNADLAPQKFAVEKWKARYGSSYSANEVAGLAGLLNDAMDAALNQNIPQDSWVNFVTDKLLRALPPVEAEYMAWQAYNHLSTP